MVCESRILIAFRNRDTNKPWGWAGVNIQSMRQVHSRAFEYKSRFYRTEKTKKCQHTCTSIWTMHRLNKNADMRESAYKEGSNQKFDAWIIGIECIWNESTLNCNFISNHFPNMSHAIFPVRSIFNNNNNVSGIASWNKSYTMFCPVQHQCL